jgi:hypothetical protein
VPPSSNPEALSAPGTYYYQASYSGDGANQASTSGCGSEKVTVTAVNTPPAIDAIAHAKHPATATATLTTHHAGDLLVALVAGDSPSTAGNTATVTGAGLTWTQARRENAARGDEEEEVWTARATGTLTNARIQAHNIAYRTYDETITVIAFANASGLGAVGAAFSKKGAPQRPSPPPALTPGCLPAAMTGAHHTPPPPGAGQTVQHTSTDRLGDTYWVQSTTAPTPVSGTPVTINDTAPTNDPYNLVLVEVL